MEENIKKNKKEKKEKKEKKDRPERTLPQLCATLVINEYQPRKDKYGYWVPNELAGLLARLEHEKVITRKTHRAALDKFYESTEEEKQAAIDLEKPK